MLKYTDIIVEKKLPIGYITINRPEKQNSLTQLRGGTLDQMAQAYGEMKDDSDIRVFIIKGSGPCFSSGFDLGNLEIFESPDEGWIKGREYEPWARFFTNTTSREIRNNPESFLFSVMGSQWWWDTLRNNPKPSIAQVHSYCLGAGLWTINHCDIVYATPDAVFGYPPVRYGCPVMFQILPPWLLGQRRVMKMALTGRLISAQEAYDCGLITEVVPRDRIDDEVRNVAESIAKVPPMTNLFTKRSIHHYYEMLGVETATRYADANCMMIENSTLPGGTLAFGELVGKKGVREALVEQMANYSTPDKVLEQERERLRAELAKDSK